VKVVYSVEKSDFTVEQAKPNQNTLTAVLRGEAMKQEEEKNRPGTPKSGTQCFIDEEE
jgi:hypothetical protein